MQLIIKKKVKIINYFINSITLNELLINISKWRQKRIPHYVCVSNVHSCIESFWNNKFKKAHNSADLAVADGRPIFWALKLLRSSNAQHLPGYHITEKIVSMANKQFIKIGFYGTTEKNLNIIHKKLKKKYKNINISYKFSPPFKRLSKKEDHKIINDINKSKVDILFVCLGCPKQELWMHEHKSKLKCTMIGIGAVADFFSGNKILPNKLFEYLGLAWLIRLITEPRRLFWRYFSTNFLFLFLFFLQITGLKKFR